MPPIISCFTHYRRRLQNVFEQLGSSTQQVPVSEEVNTRPRIKLPRPLHFAPLGCRPPRRTTSLQQLQDRYRHERACLLIACIMMRLGALRHNRDVPSPLPTNPALCRPYTTAASDLLSDLTVLRESVSSENNGSSPLRDARSTHSSSSRSAPTASISKPSTSASTLASIPPPSTNSPPSPPAPRRQKIVVLRAAEDPLLCHKPHPGPQISVIPPALTPQTAEASRHLPHHRRAQANLSHLNPSANTSSAERVQRRKTCLNVLTPRPPRRQSKSKPRPQPRPATPTPASNPSHYSSPSKTFRTPPRIMRQLWTSEAYKTLLKSPGTTARRSCSATPTPTRMAA